MGKLYVAAKSKNMEDIEYSYGSWCSLYVEDGESPKILTGKKFHTTYEELLVYALHISHKKHQKIEDVCTNSRYVFENLQREIDGDEIFPKESKRWNAIRNQYGNVNISMTPLDEKYMAECIKFVDHELSSFFRTTFPVAFIDYETSHLTPSQGSVLSVSAIRALVDTKSKKIIDVNEYNRYYYSQSGNYPIEAVKINGLDEFNISRKRGDSSYSNYYSDDVGTLEAFCYGVVGYVAHNASFDQKWSNMEWYNVFCTKNATTNILKLPPTEKQREYKIPHKSPKLSEAADYFKIEVNEKELHESRYDTLLCMLVFEKLMNTNTGHYNIMRFLKKDVFSKAV